MKSFTSREQLNSENRFWKNAKNWSSITQPFAVLPLIPSNLPSALYTKVFTTAHKLNNRCKTVCRRLYVTTVLLSASSQFFYRVSVNT